MNQISSVSFYKLNRHNGEKWYNSVMKKFILILIIMLMPILAYADFLPHNTSSIKHYGIGVLNKSQGFKIYSEPDFNSKVKKEITYVFAKSSSILYSSKNDNTQKNLFIAMRTQDRIALLTVETEQGDGWYEVCIDQRTGETGWIYDANKQDFLNWRGFFTVYGKTTGLRFMHGVPDEIQTLYAKDSLDSQIIKMLEYPKKITFSMIRGNWMLVTAHEFDGTYNIGWLKWRNDDGSLNLFPIL